MSSLQGRLAALEREAKRQAAEEFPVIVTVTAPFGQAAPLGPLEAAIRARVGAALAAGQTRLVMHWPDAGQKLVATTAAAVGEPLAFAGRVNVKRLPVPTYGPEDPLN